MECSKCVLWVCRKKQQTRRMNMLMSTKGVMSINFYLLFQYLYLAFSTILAPSASNLTRIITMFCRIRVAAAAAASSVARAPSLRRLNQKAAVSCFAFFLRIFSVCFSHHSCISYSFRTCGFPQTNLTPVVPLRRPQWFLLRLYLKKRKS